MTTFPPENLSNEKLIELLEGWSAKDCGEDPRPFLLAGVYSRLNLGRLTNDDILRVA